MADVKFDKTEIESSSIWDEGELWSLQGGSATGLTDIFFVSGLSVFSLVLLRVRVTFLYKFLSFQLLNLCLTEMSMGTVIFFFKIIIN